MSVRSGLFLAALVAVAAGASHADHEGPLGPLSAAADSQIAAPWQPTVEDGWFVLTNSQKDGAEQSLLIAAGPPPEGGRITSVTVTLAADEAEAAVGLFLKNDAANGSCVLEINAAKAANLFCYSGGAYEEVATLQNAARLDGSDVLAVAEVPGAAQFYLNGEVVGQVEGKAALGDQIGILAYDRGSFGVTGFEIAALEPEDGQGAGAASGGQDDLDAIVGPLADTIRSAEDREGWQTFLEDGWLVLENAGAEGDTLFHSTEFGMPAEDGRITELRVGMAAPEGLGLADLPYSAVGIILYNEARDASCLGEVTGAGDGLLLCFENGQATEIGRLPGIAKLDGSDVIQLLEVPGEVQVMINGQVLGQVSQHPSQGSEIGIVAYERGRFHAGGFTVTEGGAAATDAPAQGGGPVASGAPQGPLPMFDGDSARITQAYLGVITGVFLHEFGHALIGELGIPATGPEEDVVDIYSALRISSPAALLGPTEEATQINWGMATYAALQWYYSGILLEQQGGRSVPWQDEHTADLKRFRNSFCVMYGGNPDLFGSIAQEVGMEERTLARCEDEFLKQNRAWKTILAPHTRVSEWHPDGRLPADAPGAPIEVVFEPSSRKVGDMVSQIIGASGTFAEYASGLARDYALPRPIRVTFKDCGELNAWYDPREGSITMCYDLIEYQIVMISDIEMGTVGGEPAGASQGQTAAEPASGANTPFATDANPFDGQPGGQQAGAPAFDEGQDLGMPVTRELFLQPYEGPTPVENPMAKVVTTEDLAGLYNGEAGFILIDTSGRGDSLPGAMVVTDAGSDGSLTDGFQKMMDQFLGDQTGGDQQVPIVFFGLGMNDRSSYNAAMRAGALGWNALWYRGGIEAWAANGLPLEAPQ